MNKKNIESLLAKRPDFIVCTCFEVTCHQLIKAIDNGSNSLDKLIDEFGVTTGCSTCLPDIEELLTELN
jgi:NAD(P)H-nitrite reductase large subunit